MRREELASGEYYHIFNRGIEKRSVFEDANDFERFLKSIIEFNREEAIGSLYENYFFEKRFGLRKSKKLVDLVAYCLNPNHYHLLLFQESSRGISKFLQKVIMGYTKYFNKKNNRVGPLFQGAYRAVRIKSNAQLLHVSVYVNLNFQVHSIKNNFFRSSWKEYSGVKRLDPICDKSIILKQFKNPVEYKEFAEFTLPSIKDKKEMMNLDFGSPNGKSPL